jgi:hypothetical protein
LEDGPGLTPDQVGVRHKTTGELFTPLMMMALKNPNVMGPGQSGSQGAMILQANGSYVPNKNIQVDDPATLVNRDIDMSAQAIEEFTDDAGADVDGDAGIIPSKYEEEKQPDVEDPNYTNNILKQQEEDDIN